MKQHSDISVILHFVVIYIISVTNLVTLLPKGLSVPSQDMWVELEIVHSTDWSNAIIIVSSLEKNKIVCSIVCCTLFSNDGPYGTC